MSYYIEVFHIQYS